MPQSPLRKPEVMSPAGHWPQLHAAVEAGADAVYFGLKHFTARAKVGFSLAELPDALRTLHRRGVRGYVTFNTLIFEHELAEAASAIAAIAEAGADAVILQDWAAVRLARTIAPGLELHASTQMSITDAPGVELALRRGLRRITLARELSIPEIASIAAQTGADLEVFVHGALCVAYSGQCFSSEAWGGRSANRGQCAQACRLPYELIVDGKTKPLGDARYLLSPGDLYALRQLPEIVAAGVAALKIEGRYKDAEYVALATAAYRKAVDEACAGLPLSITRTGEQHLEQVYSRGMGPYFLTGTNHQAVVRGRGPRHRGVLLGRVAAVGTAFVLLEPSAAAAAKPGDGVVFDAAGWRSPEEPEEGGRIYTAAPRTGSTVELRFANGAVRFDRIRPGDLVWRSHDPDTDRAARPFLDPPAPVHRRPVHVRAVAREGEPLSLTWSAGDARVDVASPEPLQSAGTRALTAGLLREQLGRLGGTPYHLASLELETSGAPFAPVSLLNRLRREAVERLDAAQTAPRATVECDPHTALAALSHTPATASPGEPRLHLLVRSPLQLEAAIEAAPASVTLDYLDLYGLRPSVERVLRSGLAVRVATPRVLKPGEERILDFLRSLECPLLVRAAGMVPSLAPRELTGDFSLNAANSASARLFLDMGLARLTPAHDLNGAQVAALARDAGAGRIEAIAYQHLPVFHTEHCVFCRFLSAGTSYLDCGRPCDTHVVALRDSAGRAHPVLADVGCRNTVFGAEAQTAAAHLDAWLAAGIRDYRLEFAHESAAEVAAVSRLFRSALQASIPASELAAALRKAAPRGITEGSLFVPADYLTLPVLQ